MTSRFYGETFIFTSRGSGNNNNVINIKPGVGETLNINGASLSGSLVTVKTTTELDQLNESTLTDYSVSGADLVGGGLGVAMFDYSGGVYRFAHGATKTNASPNTTFYAQVQKYESGVWTQEALIEIANMSSFPNQGVTIGLDNTGGEHLCFPKNTFINSFLAIYSRVGSVWSADQDLADFNCGRISGDYLIAGKTAGYVSIYFKSGTWTEQQVLQAADGGLPATLQQTIDIYGDTAVYASFSRRTVRVFKRSGTVWSLESELERRITDSDINSVSLLGNVLAFTTNERVYIYERPDVTTKFTQKLVSDTPNINWINVASSTRIYGLESSTNVHYFMKDSLDWYEYYSQTTTGATKIAAIADYLLIGRPDSNVASLWTLANPSPATSVTTSTVDLEDQIEISSLYPSVFNNDAHFLGDVTIDGVLKADYRQALVSIGGSGNQSIANTGPITLTTVFQDNQGSIHHQAFSFDYSTGILTIGEDGVYYVMAGCEFALNSTLTRTLEIVKGASTVIGKDSKDAEQNGVTVCGIFRYFEFVAGDTIKLNATQNSAGLLVVSTAYLTAQKISV